MKDLQQLIKNAFLLPDACNSILTTRLQPYTVINGSPFNSSHIIQEDSLRFTSLIWRRQASIGLSLEIIFI